MITTKDVRIKTTKRERVGILTSNVVKPKGFKPKGKPAKRDPTIITTSNVDEHLKKLKAIERMAKAREAKKEKK